MNKLPIINVLVAALDNEQDDNKINWSIQVDFDTKEDYITFTLYTRDYKFRVSKIIICYDNMSSYEIKTIVTEAVKELKKEIKRYEKILCENPELYKVKSPAESEE